ncbi:MAG: serine/threonine-protein kinase [Planctomycetota bacterium]
MQVIRLPRGEWQFDPSTPLGQPGGFGSVFQGTNESGEQLAVKRIHLDAVSAAHRELRIADSLVGREFRHVVPVLDAGLDSESDSYFVVMARAERSLQDELDSGKRYADRDTADVMLQVATGLSEVSELTHRDLKPGNVLLHDGVWKVADFGIARFVEESTSQNTLRDFLSPEYAAPEQWRSERCTDATDIYALGCIAHALLTGEPPFTGAGESLRRKHLEQEPPTLECGTPRLRMLVSTMLRKSSEARPSLARALGQLKQILEREGQEDTSRGFSRLSLAAASLADQQGKAEARQIAQVSRRECRDRLGSEAECILRTIIRSLFSAVKDVAPMADFNREGLWLRLGGAELRVKFLGFASARRVPDNPFPSSRWDVLAAATITVTQAAPRCEIGATLWYTNLGKGDSFRWYEASYKDLPLFPRRHEFEPFAVTNLKDADAAAGTGMHTVQFAFGPRPIDDESQAEFFDRWVQRLALAADGKLS